MRLLRIVAVCGAALLLTAQATPAASPSSSVKPITGSFSGFDNENGVVTSWNGSLRFATPLSGGNCCGLTSGTVFWKVEGTDSNSGCSWAGTGRFAIVDGKMAGEPLSASATISAPYYNIDFQTPSTNGIPGYDQFGPVVETCPPSTSTTTFVNISAWIYGGYAGPYLVQPGGLLIDHDGTSFHSGGFSYEKEWRWSFQGQTCPEPNVRTGKGYDKLSETMRSRLHTLYGILEKQNACYRFNIGFRDETVQKDLYDRWHQIADGHKGQKNLCQTLKAAGFAQCPTSWTKDGKANGGPAKPGSSRHEKAEAADIKVKWPSKYDQNTPKFRAAARQADLCGPPNSDPVHVEMPYKVKGQTKATCHFT